MKIIAKMTVFSILSVTALSCGKGSKNIAAALLCGRGEQKSKMTVGLDLDTVRNVLSLNASAVSDDSVKSFLNNALEKVNISPEQFNVESVTSISEEDKVRFLQLGGNFGEAFGVASSFVKDAFSSADGLDFVQESFGVSMTTAENYYRKGKVEQFVKKYMPFLLEEENVDKFYENQWALDQTDYAASLALYNKMKDKVGDKYKVPVVAVLDTGVDLEHPDLVDSFITENGKILQYDATGSSVGADDENGHGTHCAGIIGARKKSDASPLGVATMAGVKIIPIKVLGEGGSGGFQEIEKGVRWAVSKGADVLSMSLGAGMDNSDVAKENGKIINKIFSEAIDEGSIVVVAAGNENCPLGGECDGSGFLSSSFDEYTVLPCSYDGTICVGATDQDETLAEYSNFWSERDVTNYRTQADVNAPGTAIYSTWPTQLNDGYKAISGTSMATPYVAGVAALIKSVVPDITQKDMLDILERSQAFSDDIKDKSNTGRVDLYTALHITAYEKLDMKGEGEPTIPPDAKPVTSAPEQNAGGGTIDLIGNLLNSVCAASS